MTIKNQQDRKLSLPDNRETGGRDQGAGGSLIGRRTAPRLDRGLADGGGTAKSRVTPTQSTRGATQRKTQGQQPHT